MTVFFEFIDQNARYIYVVIALIALYLLYRAVKVRRERRAAIFPLEKEVAELTIRRLFGFAILLALLLAGTWAITERFLPGLESSPVFATPTPDLVLLIDTPTPTPPPPTATPTTTPTPRPRPTRRPPPTPAPEGPPTPEVSPPSCPNPGAAIASPGNGQTVQGEIQVTGTASIDRFQFYKLEWAWEGNPDQWNWFAGSEIPVVGGVLGVFNPAGLPSGNYTIRLVVVDITGNYPPPCNVRVILP